MTGKVFTRRGSKNGLTRRIGVWLWGRLLLLVTLLAIILSLSGPAPLTFGVGLDGNGTVPQAKQLNNTNPPLLNPKSEIGSLVQPHLSRPATYAWGLNAYGQLGNNSTTDSSVPVPVSLPTGVSGFTAFAVGDYHSLGLGSDGKLYAWGYNGIGQLGNNSTTNSSVPVPVSLPTGIVVKSFAIGSTGFHNLMIVATPTTTTTTLTSSLNPAVAVQNVTLTATVTPAGATGSVVFTNTTTHTTLGTATLNGSGVASLTTSFASVGNFNLTASYTGDASFASSTSPALSQTINPISYNLPLLANNATTPLGNTTTFITFQNLSTSATANVSVQYYAPASGNSLNVNDSFSLPAYGQKAILPAIAAGSSAGGVVTSDQPLNLVVSESLNAGGSAYNVAASTAPTLYSPLALNGQYGFTTSIVVFNAANSGTSTGTIQFFDENGTLAGITQNFSVPAHASQIFNQAGSGLTNNHAYWAKISAASATDSLTAQVIEFGPANFVATFNALVPTQLQKTLYAPAVFNGQFNFVTGMAIANPNSTATIVSLKYYDANGTLLPTQSPLLAVPANGVAGVFQPNVNGLSAQVTSATISSDQPLIMAVNERGPGNVSGTYVGVASGNNNVALPVMANGFAGFVTGATVLNTSSTSAAHLTFQYRDAANGNGVGPAQPKTLPPNSSFLVFQGDAAQALPNGFFGTAIITSDQPLLVTTNALNTTNNLFYTYTEPSS